MNEQEMRDRAARARKSLGVPDTPESVAVSERAIALLMMTEESPSPDDDQPQSKEA